MYAHVDEPGGQVRARAVDHLGRVEARPPGVDAGNQCAYQPHVGASQFAGAHVNDGPIAEQQVKRIFAESGAHCSLPAPAPRQDPSPD